MDGELEHALNEQVDAHWEHCPACRTWQAEASALTRSLRVRPATATPDLVAAVLPHATGTASASGPTGAARAPRRATLARLSLGAVATAQVALGFAQTLGMGEHVHAGHGAVSSHLFNESTAWNLALGAGLLWAALRNRSAAGMLPVLSVFLVVLTGFSAYDLTVGAVAAGRVVSHGLLALGLGLLFVVHRASKHDDPSPTSVEVPDTEVDSPSPPEQAPEPDTRRKDKRTRHLRPSAHQRAA